MRGAGLGLIFGCAIWLASGEPALAGCFASDLHVKHRSRSTAYGYSVATGCTFRVGASLGYISRAPKASRRKRED